MIDLSGKIALITGSTRGIGRSCAEKFAQAGAKVVVTGRSEDRAKEVAGEINKSYGSEAYGYALDVGDKSSVEDLFKRVNEEVGGVDILVNNAGITKDTLFMRMKLEDWEKVINVNLTGTFLATSLAIKGMIKKRWGRIINMSSVVAFIGNVGQANYSASKSALIGFTKTLARELAPRNVTVNAIAPGFIETDMTDAIPEDIKENFLKQIPMGRYGSAEEVANVALFFASDLASYITGEVVHVNGGMF